MSHLRKSFARSRLEHIARPSLAFAMLLCYLASTSGFPLPRLATRDSVGTPFPCQDHGCGCSSASQCWTDCCCFTMKQKLAWAQANDVEPPQHLLDIGAAKSARNVARSCCTGKPQPEASTRAWCCESKQAGSSSPMIASCQAGGCCSKPDEPIDWTLNVRSLPCRGLGSMFTALNIPLAPPPPRVEWSPQVFHENSAPLPGILYAGEVKPPQSPPG